MQQTTNYNLAKPEYTDAADIAPISGNMDTIDTALEKARSRDADVYNQNNSYTVGDFCIYQDTLYKCTGMTTGAWDNTKWTACKIADAFEPRGTWELFETITADGTQYRYIRDLPADTSGILLLCYIKGSQQTATHLRVQVSFDNGLTYDNIAYCATAITDSDRYCRISIFRDGQNYWRAESIISQSEGGDIQLRALQNGYAITSNPLTNLQIRTSSGSAYFETGSTIQIYIKR